MESHNSQQAKIETPRIKLDQVWGGDNSPKKQQVRLTLANLIRQGQAHLYSVSNSYEVHKIFSLLPIAYCLLPIAFT
ncbi:hypothetical protein [Moorena sp. SIO3B2]|uniref:hypothetical protein n=1 Tax=Moorena sp. SIO3B2 TaxID=2607827 RepID=UPI0013C8AB94|nr:hypothetical protein [Moorena sp. SIO3B2]NEP35004.1 hypothetical protein [Moorena sp. SIO3B2]